MKKFSGIGRQKIKGGTGDILRLCTAKEYLEVYKIDKVFRVKMGNHQDLESIDFDQPGTVAVHADIGASHDLIARLVLQNYDLLRSLPLSKQLDNELLHEYLQDCARQLWRCESIFNNYVKVMESVEKAFELESQDDKNLLRLPVIPELDETMSRFSILAKQVLHRVSMILDHIFVTEIPSPKFQKISKKLDEILNSNNSAKVVANFESFTKYVADLRNGIEHPFGKDKTIIQNYYLADKDKVARPRWGVEGHQMIGVKESMRHIISSLFTFCEHIMLTSLSDLIIDGYGVGIVQIGESNIDDKCPIRFKSEQLTGLGK